MVIVYACLCGSQSFHARCCDTSEQHKDSTQSRIKRDTEDTYKILNTLSALNPFGPDPSLRGLVSGLVAHESVNVDDAKEVGELILKSMVGQGVTSISFERNKQSLWHRKQQSKLMERVCKLILSLVGDIESQHSTIVESLQAYTSESGTDRTLATVTSILLSK